MYEYIQNIKKWKRRECDKSIFSQEKDAVKSINEAFEKVNTKLIEKLPSEGCTAGIIIVSNEKVYSINLGDVRAVMEYPDGSVKGLSHDHKASDSEEKKLLKKRI